MTGHFRNSNYSKKCEGRRKYHATESKTENLRSACLLYKIHISPMGGISDKTFSGEVRKWFLDMLKKKCRLYVGIFET